MNNVPNHRPGAFVLAAIIAAFSAGCADEASRMEAAREHQKNAEYRAAIIELKNILQSDRQNAEARALLGEITLQNGDTATAIKELHRARELGASPDQYAVPLARALLSEKRLTEVVRFNPETLADSTNQAALLALMGKAELELDNEAAAEKNFSAALALVPGQPDALLGKSRLAIAKGDLDAAQSGLQQLLESSPGDGSALAELAMLQHNKGDFAAAEDNFSKALEQIEGTARAQDRLNYMSGLMESLLAQDKNTQAQGTGSRMIEMSGQHPLALYQAARADFAVGDNKGAIDKAQRVITTAPTAEAPKMLLAAAAMADGDTGLAATQLQAAVNVNPDNTEARKMLAQIQMKRGNPADALELLEPLIAAGTSDAVTLALAGQASIRGGNEQAGLELIEQGIASGIEDPALAVQAAANFMITGDIDRAIEILESVPEEENIGQRELLLVLAMLRKGDTDGARARAQSIASQHPGAVESHRLMGGFHLAVGELDESRRQFDKALELRPGDVAAIVNLARIDIAQGKHEQAEARFLAVLENKPGDLVALTSLARVAQNRGDSEASVAYLEQARSANPNAIAPHMTLAQFYLQTGNLELAEERADQAVRASPSNGEAHTLLGIVLLRDGRHTEAAGRFEAAIDVAPGHVPAHYHLGQALAASGQDERSFDAFQRAVEIDGTYYPAKIGLARAATSRGDYNLAMSLAESLVSDYPERTEPLILLAHVNISRGAYQQALESYQKAATIGPSADIANYIYQVRKSMGEKEPWKPLEQWVATHPKDTKGQFMLAAAYKDARMYDRAIDNLERVMATAPDAGAAASLAEAYGFAGKPDAAARWLRKSVELEPTSFPARRALAALELQLGNTDAALNLINELRKEDPNAPDLDVLQGDALLASGDSRRGIAAYDRALARQPSELVVLKRYRAGALTGEENAWQVLKDWLEEHPGDIRVGLQLAQDYGRRGWHDETIKAYRAVLEADPNNIPALNNLAWAHIERGNEGDLKLGLFSASKAYGKQPQIAAIGDTYGWLLLQDGQSKRAVEILGKAASSADATPDILYHHAVALDTVGRDAEAASLLNRLLADQTPFDSREEAEALKKRLSP